MSNGQSSDGQNTTNNTNGQQYAYNDVNSYINLTGAPPVNPNNALVIPGVAWPPVIDHTTKQVLDQRFQAMQAQLDAWRASVDHQYTQYTALEKMIEDGERAKQQLAMLHAAAAGTVTPTARSARPAVPSFSMPSTSQASGAYNPYRSTIDPQVLVPEVVVSSARIEEVPPSPAQQSAASKSNSQQQNMAQRHPRQQENKQNQPSASTVQSSFRPSQSTRQSEPNARPNASTHQPSQPTPQQQYRPPPNIPTSATEMSFFPQQVNAMKPTAVPQPREEQYVPHSQRLPVPPVSSYSTLNGALGSNDAGRISPVVEQGTHPSIQQPVSNLTGARKLPSRPTTLPEPSNATSSSTSIPPSIPSSSTTPTPSGITNSLTASDLPPEIKKYIPSIEGFLQGVRHFAAVGKPNAYYCNMQTIRVRKDDANRVWIHLLAKGKTETVALKDLTMDLLLHYVGLWKQVSGRSPLPSSPFSSGPLQLPTTTASSLPSEPASTATTLPTVSTPTQSASTSSSVQTAATRTPDQANKSRLAKDILRALGYAKKQPKQDGSSLNIKDAKEVEKVLTEGASASSSKEITMSDPNKENLEHPPIAHTSSRTSPQISQPTPAPPTSASPALTSISIPSQTSQPPQAIPNPTADTAPVRLLPLGPFATQTIPGPSLQPYSSTGSSVLPPSGSSVPQTSQPPQAIPNLTADTAPVRRLSLGPFAMQTIPGPPLQPYSSTGSSVMSPSGSFVPPIPAPTSLTTSCKPLSKQIQPPVVPIVEIPVKSPKKMKKQKEKEKEAKTPLFLPSSTSSSPEPEANFDVDVDTMMDLTARVDTPTIDVFRSPVSVPKTTSRRRRQEPYVLVPLPSYVTRHLARTGTRLAGEVEVISESDDDDVNSRIGSLVADSSAGSAYNEPDLEETRLIWEAGERMRRRPCKWKECDFVMNSGKSLLLHLRLMHGEEAISTSLSHFVCTWQQCGQMFRDKEYLFKHFERHALYPLQCIHEGCEETFRSPRQLSQHYAVDHREDDEVRITPGPVQPDALPPAPDLPSKIPPYILTARVLPASISKERHDVFGPWVLRRIFGPVNLGPKRHNAAAIRLLHDNPYEFLSAYKKPARVPDMEDLNSEEVSYAVNSGLTLWPGPDRPARPMPSIAKTEPTD